MATTKAAQLTKTDPAESRKGSDECGKTACEQRDEKVRLLAYLRWEQATGGNPVDDEATRRFWEEAAQTVDSEES